MNITQIDTENKEFCNSILKEVEAGSFPIKDILGFSIKGSAVFIPRVPCARVLPSGTTCKGFDESRASSIFTLTPVHDTLIYPIPNEIVYAKSETKITASNFSSVHGVSLNDFITCIHAGKIVPYFTVKYQYYDADLIGKFLEPGMPRISQSHMQLLRKHSECKVVNSDCRKCNSFSRQAEEDIIKTQLSDSNVDEETRRQVKICAGCLGTLYALGISRERILQTDMPLSTTCALMDILASRNLDAVYKSNCSVANDALEFFANANGNEESLGMIVSGLNIRYSSDIDLAQYLEFLDSKTTRAVREIAKKMMDDPFASKYQERLNSKIYQFNREVEELGNSRAAKFYHAISDIAVYGGNKYVEQQTNSLLKISKKNVNSASDWITSKILDLHAKATGKDWTIAQIYKIKTKIEKCKTTDK